jgi:uncharacterized protein YbjT (DUF2867 family)
MSGMKIAVAGGTGLIGTMIVEALSAGGDTPIVLARSAGVDLTTGEGLDARLAGASAVIDVSNVTTLRARKSAAFFAAATRNLLSAGQRAGVGHHVVLSIVGIDRVPFGYYLGKRRQEELALSGPVPATVLRATQFHEFAGQLLARGGPVVPVPAGPSQPIAAREVADLLVAISRAEPAGLLPDLAGPRAEYLPDLVRRVARARGPRRLIIPVRLPGAVGRAMAAGGLLPAGDGPRGTQTFSEWLGGRRGQEESEP